MAEKRRFMQMPSFTPLPKQKTVTLNRTSLNKRQTIDTGQITHAVNVSFDEYPYITTRRNFEAIETEMVHNGHSCIFVHKDVVFVKEEEQVDASANHSAYIKPWFMSVGKLEGARGPYKYLGKRDYDDEDSDGNSYDYLFPVIYSDIYNRITILSAISSKIYTFISEADKTDISHFDTDLTDDGINKVNEGTIITNEVYKETTTYRPNRYVISQNNRLFCAGYYEYTSSKATVFHSDRIMITSFDSVYCSTGSASNDGWVSVSDETSPFNGICAYKEDVIAFKKNYMYIISGQKNPYTITQFAQVGCVDERTVCNVGGILYFLAYDGVYKFNGGALQCVSSNVITGSIDETAENVGGTDGRHYFLQCRQLGGDYHFFVYDTLFQTWTEYSFPDDIVDDITEDNATIKGRIVQFAHLGNAAYFVSLVSKNVYKLTAKTSETAFSADYDGVKWEIETDFKINGSIDIKHVDKLQILADVGVGSEVNVSISYDGGEFKQLYSYENNDSNPVQKRILIRPKKTAHYGYKVRISGTGYVKLYQMEAQISGTAEQDK